MNGDGLPDIVTGKRWFKNRRPFYPDGTKRRRFTGSSNTKLTMVRSSLFLI